MSREKSKTAIPRVWLLGALLGLGVWLAIPALASAATPQWSLDLSAFPSSFASGESGNAAEGPAYRIVATNKGDAPTAGAYEIADVLPADLAPVAGEVQGEDEKGNPLACVTTGQEVSCSGSEALEPGEAAEVIVPVEVPTGLSGRAVFDEASVEGGGAAVATAKLKTAIGLPAWKLLEMSEPTNIPPGGKAVLHVVALNIGGTATHGPTTITDVVPPGLTVIEAYALENGSKSKSSCTTTAQVVTCTLNEASPPGLVLRVGIEVEADPLASGTEQSEATVEGGGAAPAVTTMPVTISPAVAPFDFLPGDGGFSAPLTNADGSAAVQAGSHPNQLTLQLGFPSEEPFFDFNLPTESPRDIAADLPPGEIVNPNSTAELCTQAELVTGRCPPGSQIGETTVLTSIFRLLAVAPSPLYNMVPTLGSPSTFGFDAAEVGIFTHIEGSLRSDGDYGLSGTTREVLAVGAQPLYSVRLDFWGDPSSSSHDSQRLSGCHGPGTSGCPAAEETKTALLTAPVQCSGQPTVTRGRADSWEHSGVFKTASYESADLAGTPVATNGCNQLQYEPSIEARPTTGLADSPSGLDVDVHQPINEDPGGISPAMMNDIRLALPKGMSVNPSSAEGLGACTEAQAHVHSLTPTECPADSKLGPAEVITPLQEDPLKGALYLAQPFKNPRGSLIGLYLEISNPDTGIVSNLAGEVKADPQTGQLTTVFEENPQLPLEHIRTKLFTGPRAALRTPAACGNYASRADMTPWSAPQTPVAHPTDPWTIQANPNGGACPSQGQALPSNPSFTAGTLDPQAAAYTPFVFKLTRQDDTAEVQKIDTTLPPGLTAKLAGVPYCPEAGIQRAQSRNKPNEGVLEQNDPSCPAASKVGTVKIASGAGITPLHVQGNAYLAGPYKGAPLSLAVITPAIAGPFDLGTVVVRIALHLDPETAKVTATSDPLPTILYGIPLDIRQIAFELDRNQFTLNPTSCDPMSIGGTLTTATGSASPLQAPFQVGNCAALAFKPKLALRLKGGTTRGAHPALSANLTFPKTGPNANVKTAQVTLPHAEFLDQSHIGTVCTRVQFQADQCPAKSIYGKATATTPLLEDPLSGPVYLRSSSHELPDLVVDLKGQVEVVLDGRIDSINGGIRTTFEAAPDAPVSKFTLQMQGAKKGLLVNSTNLCKHSNANKAISEMEGQNGKVFDTEPALANSCKKAKRHKKHKSSR
ncbi:MAG TPA: hypothetical protein VGH58_07770 [Solirubrobacterales bacterium]|jgi:hypothetical protein